MPRDHLDRKPKMDDVAVLDDIIFAFQAELARFFALRLAAVCDELVVRDHFGANKSTLDVAVDFACGFLCGCAMSDRPSADFIFACRKETDQIQKSVGSADKPVTRRLLDTDLFEECHPVAFIELRDFHFYLAGESEPFQSAPLAVFLVGCIDWPSGFFVSLIEDDQQGLAAEKAEASGQVFFVGAEVQFPQA